MIDTTRRRIVQALATAPAALAASPVLLAQTKPLTILLTSQPGTSGDTLARLLGEHLRAKLKRPVIVLSKAGAGSLVAMQFMREYPADGSYVILCPSSAISLVPLFSTKPTYDVDRDVQAIVDCASSPLTLTVLASTGLTTMAEYFQSVTKNSASGSIGVPSPAGTGALVIYQLGKQLNLPLQAVPYRGGAPLLADLLGNQVPAGASILADYLEQHRAGRLKMLAHASEKRSPLAPDVPTFAEAGYPGYVVVTSIGLYAKGGTPMSITNDYAGIVTQALASDPVIETLHRMGLIPVGGTPAELTRKLAAERMRWEPLIKASGIRMDA
jgi:tripartite-type tricarboxylate transporter receptor subunit TctC